MQPIIGVIHSAIDRARWRAQLPSVEDARPNCCPRCKASAKTPDRRVQLIGHGIVLRQLWGPIQTDQPPGIIETITLRRYRCRACGTVIRVGPAIIERRAMYSTLAIVLALALWAAEGMRPEDVQRYVSPFSIRSLSEPMKWPSLKRWGIWLLKGRLWAKASNLLAETLRATVSLHLCPGLDVSRDAGSALIIADAVLALRHRDSVG